MKGWVAGKQGEEASGKTSGVLRSLAKPGEEAAQGRAVEWAGWNASAGLSGSRLPGRLAHALVERMKRSPLLFGLMLLGCAHPQSARALGDDDLVHVGVMVFAAAGVTRQSQRVWCLQDDFSGAWVDASPETLRALAEKGAVVFPASRCAYPRKPPLDDPQLCIRDARLQLVQAASPNELLVHVIVTGFSPECGAEQTVHAFQVSKTVDGWVVTPTIRSYTKRGPRFPERFGLPKDGTGLFGPS